MTDQQKFKSYCSWIAIDSRTCKTLETRMNTGFS